MPHWKPCSKWTLLQKDVRQVEVVTGLPVDPWLQAKLKETEAQLIGERDTAFQVLNLQ
jgi:hypothetical protein